MECRSFYQHTCGNFVQVQHLPKILENFITSVNLSVDNLQKNFARLLTLAINFEVITLTFKFLTKFKGYLFFINHFETGVVWLFAGLKFIV